MNTAGAEVPLTAQVHSCLLALKCCLRAGVRDCLPSAFAVEYLVLDEDDEQIIGTQVGNVYWFVTNTVFTLIHALEV